MSRKHFQAIARIVRELTIDTERYRVAIAFADLCATINPRFNRERFFIACGVPEALKWTEAKP